MTEPKKKSSVEEELTIQYKPQRGKWIRRALMASGVLAMLFLVWVYILPLLSPLIHP
jgi:hypothetical protein